MKLILFSFAQYLLVYAHTYMSSCSCYTVGENSIIPYKQTRTFIYGNNLFGFWHFIVEIELFLAVYFVLVVLFPIV